MKHLILPLAFFLPSLATNVSADSWRLAPTIPVIETPVSLSFQGEQPGPGKLTVVNEKTGDEVEGKQGQYTFSRTGYYRATWIPAKGEAQAFRFPVIHRPLSFLIWPPLRKDEASLRNLSSTIVLLPKEQSTETRAFWKARGSTVLATAYFRTRKVAPELEKDPDWVATTVNKWIEASREADGVYIDEFGSYPDEAGLHQIRISNELLQRYRQARPEAAIYAAVAGFPVREQALGLRAAQATALLESYEPWLREAFGTQRYAHYIDDRISSARQTDLIAQRGKRHGAMLFIGYDGVYGGMTAPELEDAVRYARRAAPEMPGMAFYASGRTRSWLEDEKLRSFANDLCERYFIWPVLEAGPIFPAEPTPTHGKETNFKVRIHNLGGMESGPFTVSLFARHLAEGGEATLVGEHKVQSVGVGTEQRDDSTLKAPDYRRIKVDGREVPIFDKHSLLFRDRTTLSFEWTPPRPGAYELHAVISPGKEMTLLDGVRTLQIVVQ